MSITYISKFSAAVTNVNVTSFGTIYITVNVFGIDRGTGEKYIVNTLVIDIPQRVYLGCIFSESPDTSEIMKLIASEIVEMVPDTFRTNGDFEECVKNIDLGPWIKWKYPVRKKGEKWKCIKCRGENPEHAIRWIKKGSVLSRRHYCFDCGIIAHKMKPGIFVLVTYSGGHVIFTESDAEIYMSVIVS